MHDLPLLLAALTSLLQSPGFEPIAVLNLSGPRWYAVRLSDLDGDALNDVLVGGRHSPLQWRRNLGNGVFATPIDIAGGTDGVIAIASADLNNDGMIDVVAASHGNSNAAYFRNLGGSFAPPVILPAVTGIKTIEIADVDGDAWLDVVVTETAVGKVSWYRNLDGNSFSAPNTVAGDATRVWGLAVGDISLDGFVDVAWGSLNAQIAWNANSGAGAFFGSVTVATVPVVFDLALGDVTGDGAPDLAFAGAQVGWLENANGTLHNPATLAPASKCVAIRDVNMDGFGDIISSSVWVAGGDGGPLSSAIALPTSGNFKTFDLAPLTDDTGIDIALMEYGGAVHILENTFRNDCDQNGIPDTIEISSGAAADCDGDSIPDNCQLAHPENDKNENGVLDACEVALLVVAPSYCPSATGARVQLEFSNVPDGSAILRLGPVAIPFVASNGTGAVQVPSLSLSSATDVVVDGWIEWNGGAGRSEVLPDAFRWVVPKVTAVVPAAVPFDGTSSVAIQLADNVVTFGTGLARFGEAAPQLAHWFPVGGSTVVTTTAPAQPQPGDYPIELEITAGGVTETCVVASRGLIYLGPGLTSMSTVAGYQGGGELVTFGLVDFHPGVPVQVAFGSAVTSGDPVGFLASSTLTVSTPFSATPGVVDVTLTQNGPSGPKIVTSPAAFEYVAPSIGNLTNVAGPQAGGQAMTAATAGFQPGTLTVRMGGSATQGVVHGTGSQQYVEWTTPAAAQPGVTQIRFTQGALEAVKPGAYDYKAPVVISADPPKGAWYGAHDVTLFGANFAPTLPATVTLAGHAPLPAQVVAPDRATFQVPAGFVAVAGPLGLTLSQATVNATALHGWTSLPALTVQVAGDAANGGTVAFHVDSVQGGVAYILIAAATSPVPLPLPDIHHALQIDPLGVTTLGAGGLLVQPTFAIAFPPNAVPPGTTLFTQALAGELGPLGFHLSFTQPATLTIR